MINSIVADFIEVNMANEVLDQLPPEETTLRNAERLFSSKIFPQKSKDGILTLKQKDSVFLISEQQSYLWGDVDLPDTGKVKILDPSQIKFRNFIARYLIDEYDMKSKIVLIWQSKADKSETFSLSQGTFVRLCGNANWRINVAFIKKSAPIIKELGVSRADFYNACRIKQSLDFAQETKSFERFEAQYNKLLKKYPGLDALSDQNLLPLYDSPEMNITGWYLN